MDDNKQQLNDTFTLIENDPRYQEIRERNLANHNKYFKDWPYEYQKQFLQRNPPEKGKSNLRRDSEEEFRKLYSEDAKRLDEQEVSRIYANPDNDPVIEEVKREVARISQQDRQQALSGQWGKISQEEAQRNSAYDDKFYKRAHMQEWGRFIGSYPTKAQAYSAHGHQDIQEAYAAKERLDKLQQPKQNRQAEQPVQQTPQPKEVTDSAQSNQGIEPIVENPTPVVESENSTGLIKALNEGISELKSNPNAQVISGIDRGSFELLVARITGTNDISHPEGLNFIESQLKSITQNSPELAILDVAYRQLTIHYAESIASVSQQPWSRTNPDNVKKTIEQELLKAKSFTATVLSLPQELATEQSILAVSKSIFGSHFINPQNYSSKITSALSVVIQNNPNSDEQIKNLTTSAIRLASPKEQQLQRIVIANLKRLQRYPMASSLAGIPYESFSILVKKLTGKSDLKLGSPGGLKEAIAIINGLDINSQALNTTVPIYEMLRRHSVATRFKLQTADGEEMTPVQKEIALKYMPEQMFLATVLTELPDEIAADPVVQNYIEAELKDYDIHADKQRETSIFNKVNNALTKSGKTVDPEKLKLIAKNTAKNISNTIPKGVTLGQAALAVALTLANQLPKDQEAFAGEQIENLTTSGDEMEDEFGFGGGGMAIGGVLGLTKYGKQKSVPQGDEEAFIKTEYENALKQKEAQTTPATSPTEPVISKAASGFFANAAIKIRGGIGTAVKGLGSFLTPGGWIGKISGFLGSLLQRGGQNQSPALAVPSELRNISVGVAILIGVLIASFFIGDNKKAAAFVTQLSGCEAGTGGLNPIIFGEGSCPIVNPIIAQNPTATPFQQQPNPTNVPIDYQPGQSDSIPGGFPLNSSCVTQKPGASFSHKNLNAVDLVVVGNNPDSWTIRATHNGKVTFAGCSSSCTRGYGYYAIIRSLNNQFLTYYGHMQLGSLRVKTGDNISKGQPLGIVNTTGFSTGNHLHYELRALFGQYYNQYGAIGTILNFLPAQSTWQCNI